MTWTIWINFLPLYHGGSTWNLASVGPVVSEKIFEHTHTHTQTHRHTYIHTYIHILYATYIHTYAHQGASALNKLYMYSCTPEHNNCHWQLFQMKNMGGGGGERGGGGAWKAKHYLFVGDGGAVVLFVVVLFNPLGGWLLWKCIIFCRCWSFSKMQFCGYPLFKWDLLEWKNDEQTKSWFSREVKPRRIHCNISR